MQYTKLSEQLKHLETYTNLDVAIQITAYWSVTSKRIVYNVEVHRDDVADNSVQVISLDEAMQVASATVDRLYSESKQ